MKNEQFTKDDIPNYAPETIELPNGWSARIDVQTDIYTGPPWEEHDGHGVISEWTMRDRWPGERLLCSDRSSRYYDIAETQRIALRDGWGCGIDEHKHATKRERAACAVEQDFQRMRAWCNDEWQWIGVVVTVFDAEGEKVSDESLWGVEGDGDYWREVAAELLNEQLAGVLIPV